MTKVNVADVEADLKSLIEILKAQSGTGLDAQIPSDKVPSLLELAEYEYELVRLAKYSRARNLLLVQWRGFVIGAAATITAISVIMGSPIGEAIRNLWPVK